MIIVVALGMFFSTLDVIDLLFQAKGESRVSAWVRMSACVLANLLKVALILSRAPVLAFAAAGVVELALSATGWLWALRWRGGRVTAWRCELKRAGALLHESWPLAVSSVAIYAQAYFDQLVIGSYLGGAELGQYAAAIRLISVFGFVPTVVLTVSAPEITRAKRDDETLYQRRLHSLYRFMFGLFLVTALPLILLGPPAARLLYGMSYAGAAAAAAMAGLPAVLLEHGRGAEHLRDQRRPVPFCPADRAGGRGGQHCPQPDPRPALGRARCYYFLLRLVWPDHVRARGFPAARACQPPAHGERGVFAVAEISPARNRRARIGTRTSSRAQPPVALLIR